MLAERVLHFEIRRGFLAVAIALGLHGAAVALATRFLRACSDLEVFLKHVDIVWVDVALLNFFAVGGGRDILPFSFDLHFISSIK